MPATTLCRFIKQIRKKRNLTQEFLAAELGISRPSYIQIEQGERDLAVPEAEKLAGIFGLSLEDFLRGRDTAMTAVICEKPVVYRDEHHPMRISVPQKNVEIFKEVLLDILAKVGGKPNVGESVLYKLLYFIDFDFMKNTSGNSSARRTSKIISDRLRWNSRPSSTI